MAAIWATSLTNLPPLLFIQPDDKVEHARVGFPVYVMSSGSKYTDRHALDLE